MWKSNLRKPICQFGGRVVQEQHCKWLSNTKQKLLSGTNRPKQSRTYEKVADKEGMRGTAWVRKVAYEALQREFTSSEYKIAEAKDELMWRESVQRRIDGESRKTKHCANDGRTVSSSTSQSV